jgi:hypothetical protein
MQRILMIGMIVALAALPLIAGAQESGSGTYLIPRGAHPNEPSVGRTGGAVGTEADHDLVREAQMALRDAGYDPGRIDGVMGRKTRAALREFQASQGLPQTGRLDETTQQQLLTQHKPSSSSQR